MPTIITNSFSQWELSERENIEGQMLSFNQKCVIQNIIASLAKEKIDLTYDLKDTPTYWQREAELQGQILILSHILQCAETAASDMEAYMQATGNAVDMSQITGASTDPFAGATYGQTPNSDPQ